ncbi:MULTISPECIES: helix-turn-helix transcriptional regulator [Mycobacterium]|uniref:Helix-turn-helix transcriptional regulator n=1 Tax=Mycobacterium paragordonae TaxID=1389713 RepID=A0AAJ1SIP6_9MYCO|nr:MULTISPECIES: helix-turn-helix transcriptional regulator [Mycobacterium]MDP7739734.1 helix-turn-helix transcriptional regulator [Mycobacterium paragordonae]
MLQPPVRGFNRSAVSRIRREAGLSMPELGLRTGLDPSVLSRWEAGATSPTPECLRRFADAMGVSTSIFVDTPPEERTLADLRSLAGFSQRALAKHLQLPFKTLARLENGLIDLDSERAGIMAAALEVTVPELVAAYKRGAIQMLRQRIDELESLPIAATA